MKELSKKTSIILWTIISIIFAIMYTVVCKKLEVYGNGLYIERTIFIFGIIEFIGLNIIIGLKKLWDFIIDNRYKIALIWLALFTVFEINGSSIGAIVPWTLESSKNNVIMGNFRYICSDEYAVEAPFSIYQKKLGMNQFANLNGISETDMNMSIHAPTLTLVTIFRIYNIGYFFLNSGMAFSFAWNLKILATILVTYELMRIITNDKKYLSLIGTILVACSSFVNWWMSVDILVFGELAVIAFNQFMLSKNKKSKILWSTVLAYSGISYILSLYPAWIISFGYIFLSLAIWVIIKNRKEYQFKIFDFVCLFGIILAIAAFGMYFYHISYDAIHSISHSSYPGARNEEGGNGIKFLFSYLYSFMLPFGQKFNTKELGSFLSFFPIPMIIAIIYIYQKGKHINFILPLLIVLCLESIWCMTGLPNIIAKITLLNKVPVERCAVAVGLGTIYLYIYMFANVEERFIKQSHSVYIILSILILLFFIPLPNDLNTKLNLYIFIIVETIGGFLLLNIGDKKYETLFFVFAVIITLVSGITVNPIVKGVGPVTETDFAKVVQEEVSKNPDKIWITENMSMVLTNCLVAQGTKTLNATQTYPNEEFWKTILEDRIEDYRDIWNRYTHIKIQLISKGKPYVKLITSDCVELYLTPEKLKELNVHYIVSYQDSLEDLGNFSKIYSKQIEEKTTIDGEKVFGIFIYEFVN